MTEFKYLEYLSPNNEYIKLEQVYQLKRIADSLEIIAKDTNKENK